MTLFYFVTVYSFQICKTTKTSTAALRMAEKKKRNIEIFSKRNFDNHLKKKFFFFAISLNFFFSD